MKPLVMVFLKAPRPGTVKTRLGREIGTAGATRLYRRLAKAQLARLPAGLDCEIHYAPHGAGREMWDWLGSRHTFRVQRGGNLGERLNHGFARGFARGFQPILAIGADCPGLDGDCLQRAAAALTRVDVVLGPASDGGYYLIGLRQPAPRLFDGIAWGGPTVLAATRSRIRKCGLSSLLLDTKDDIDELADWRRHEAKAHNRT